MRLRIQFGKEEPVRYISHLDLARAFERAIRRAKIPVAMSEGFNPHVKVAYASALSVGITSSGEYVDIEMREEIDGAAAVEKLRQQMPEGLTLKHFTVLRGPAAALMAIVNLAEYTVVVPVEQNMDIGLVRERVQRVRDAKTLPIVRHTPKGRKEMDARTFIADIELQDWNAEKATFRMKTYITDKGAIKPSEVVQVLKEYAEIPIRIEEACFHREGLYVVREARVLSPLEVVR